MMVRPKRMRQRRGVGFLLLLFPTVLMVGLIASSVWAQTTQPRRQAAPATQPAAAALSPDERLYQRIVSLKAPPAAASGQDREAVRRQVSEWVQQVLNLCNEYLAKFPEGRHVDEVQLGRLWLLATQARVDGKPYDEFYKTAEQLQTGKASARVKAEARYVLLRRELFMLRKELIADRKMSEDQKRAKWDTALKQKFSAFVEDYPDSPKNAELLAELIRLALKDEDVSRAQALMARRTKQFPDDPRAAWLAERIREAAAATQPASGAVIDLTLKTITGETINLKDLRGKVVLLDFWATWCAPCIEALPTMKKLHATYHAKGLKLIGISLDDSLEAVQEFVKGNQIAWPQYCDTKAAASPVAEKFEISAVPTLLLLDKTGRVALRLPGLSSSGLAKLEAKIKRLLAAEVEQRQAGKSRTAPATQPIER